MSSLATADSASGGSGLGSLLIFAIPVLLILFMFWQQRRKQRAMQQQQAALGVGDEARTTSGMYGRIVALDDAIATLEVSPGVQVRYDRRAVVAAPAAPPADTAPAEPEEQVDTDEDTDQDTLEDTVERDGSARRSSGE